MSQGTTLSITKFSYHILIYLLATSDDNSAKILYIFSTEFYELVEPWNFPSFFQKLNRCHLDWHYLTRCSILLPQKATHKRRTHTIFNVEQTTPSQIYPDATSEFRGLNVFQCDFNTGTRDTGKFLGITIYLIHYWLKLLYREY